MIKTRTWILLIGILLILSVSSLVLMQSGKSAEAATASICLNNVCIRTIDLSEVDEPYSFPVTGENGTNLISVENGRIRVSEADCPDQVCVNQGWQSDGLTPIVCLPNKLVIRLEANETASASDDLGLDGVIQ